MAPKIKAETLAKVELIGGWDNVMIANVVDPNDKSAEGARLGTYAKQHNMDAYEMATALLQRNRGNVHRIG